MPGFLKVLLLGGLAILISGCGGSSSTPPPPQGSTVTVTFGTATPSAVATQTGNAAFTQASLTGNTVSLVLPAGATNYAIAYICPSSNGSITETVLEATVQDGVSFTRNCPTGVLGIPGGAAANGAVDASPVPGATQVRISGKGGVSPMVAVSGSFSVTLPPGMQDVALQALDANLNVLAVKMEPAQTIPGTLNGGNTILFGPADLITRQTCTLTNLASTFLGGPFVQYKTVNGTVFALNSVSSNGVTSYAVVPAAATQSGDSYLFAGLANTVSTPGQPVTPIQILDIEQRTTSGGGPVTLALPAPWSFPGPQPATFPTFTFNYAGFPQGLNTVAEQAEISWSTASSTRNSISITASANFLNGAVTLAIPDLSSISGFPGAAPSGTTVNWIADISASTAHEAAVFATPPVNVSTALVQNSGTYTQP